jgi:phosphoribosyl 1,2-cyclic phosphodiesterase
MRIKFWGVRGGLAAPGDSTQDVGGNTSCIEVRTATGALIILDAGIGLYWLGRSLLAGPHGRGQGETTLFLSRTHWDHISGIPFFVPAFLPGNKVHVHGSPHVTRTKTLSLRNILEGQMNEVYSPIASLTNMPSMASVEDVGSGKSIEVGGAVVRSRFMTRTGDAAVSVAYRIEEDGRSLVYVTDVDYPESGPDAETVAFARGADLLIHEAFYTQDERRKGASVAATPVLEKHGHATFAEATELALRANVKSLLYTHHHPDRTDVAIGAAVEGERATVRARGSKLPVDTAREGVEMPV